MVLDLLLSHRNSNVLITPHQRTQLLLSQNSSQLVYNASHNVQFKKLSSSLLERPCQHLYTTHTAHWSKRLALSAQVSTSLRLFILSFLPPYATIVYSTLSFAPGYRHSTNLSKTQTCLTTDARSALFQSEIPSDVVILCCFCVLSCMIIRGFLVLLY